MAGRAMFGLPLRRGFTPFNVPQTTSRCLHCRSTLVAASNTRVTIQRLKKNPPGPAIMRRGFARDSRKTVKDSFKLLFRQNPVSVTVALTGIFAGFCFIIYVCYYDQTYIIGAYHKYPEDVAKKLRRAVYYTKTNPNPREAIKYYKQALDVANEVGMDPFSDEVMGIKIQVAALLEDAKAFKNAIEVLERTRAENLSTLEVYDVHPSAHKDPENRKKRTRILNRTVAMTLKLGELYSNPAIWDRDMAVERLVWAVETAQREQIRRNEAGATDESDGPWFTNEEQGATYESLAHAYEAKDMHFLSTPLFLQALSLKETTDCHSVVLMNNLASSLSQQSPYAARAAQAYAESRNIRSPDTPSGPVATKEMLVDNARQWAEKALDIAQNIKPPLRTEECDVGCAVATHNLGEFAEMMNDVDTAQKRYKEAVSLSRAIGFEEGVENSSARLRALAGDG